MKKKVLAAMMVLLLCLAAWPGSASADVLTEDLPEVSAQSYAVIDGDTNQVLFGVDYDTEVDPGSLVQMMTAVIVIEEGNLNDSVTVPEIPEAANSGNRLYLRKGEKVNLNDLLEGIIIYNANDAAIAAATHMAGSEDAFVEEMNAKAKDLGMDDTTFTSVYGSADGQTSTAHDLAILASYASNLPKYVELAIQPELEWSSEMNEDTVSNVNGMQNVEQQAIGLKINNGDTVNLTASLSQGDRTVVGVMLECDSEDTAYTDMQTALNLALENTSVVDLIAKDETMTTLNFGDDKTVRVAATQDYAVTTSEGNSGNYHSTVVINRTSLPINEGDEVGVVRIYDGDEAIDEVPLVARDSVSAGINWLTVLLVAMVLLYVVSALYIYLNVRKLRQRQSSNHRASRSSGSKKVPPARASRPRQNTSGTGTHSRPQQKKPAGNTNHVKNPSAGSSAGRQGLEQRLKEKQSGPTSGGRR